MTINRLTILLLVFIVVLGFYVLHLRTTISRLCENMIRVWTTLEKANDRLLNLEAKVKALPKHSD